ncbi:MAG: HlyD family efflux transporter periplasmic adaptor subunit [Acutalibacteraceae bacterium]
MKNKWALLYVAVFVFIAAYAAYNIYLRSISDIDTQYAVIAEAYSTVDTECFVIRDENHGKGNKNTAIIKNSGKGVYIPYVEDGSRVASGDIIALFFSSEKSAKAYREKQILSRTLDYYKKLQNQTTLSTLDIDKLEKTINDNLISYISACENNNYSSVSEILDTLKYDISSKKIATGEKLDFSVEISSLESQISELSKSSDNYTAIRAKFPGCYISTVDGFESSADYTDVSSLTVNEVNSLIESEPSKVSSSAIGKIIDEYNWYAVCNIPKDSLEKLYIGKKVLVTFENTNVSLTDMEVYSISPVTDGYSSVVLVSNMMSPDIALLRKEKIKIVIDEFEGLKVPREAIRNAETSDTADASDISQSQNLGVYILYGQVVRFRKIDVIYFGDDYAIVSRNTESSDSLKLYDMIITKGRNLYDGKIIG